MAPHESTESRVLMRSSTALGRWAVATAILILVVGAAVAVGGLYLTLIGGSHYYLVSGLLLVVDAFLLFRSRRLAYPLFAVIFGGTIVWAKLGDYVVAYTLGKE